MTRSGVDEGSRFRWCPHRIKPSLRLDLAFHAKAFPLNDHGLRMMQQPIQDGRRQRAVVVKDLRPLLISSIRRDHHRTLFIAK